jgi:hypothetical protein
MTRPLVALASLFVLSAALVGCGGGATVMRRGAWSGELALHGSITDAQYAAEDEVMAHCQGRARFVYGAEAERVAIADGETSPSAVRATPDDRMVRYVCVSRAPEAYRTGGHHEAPADAASATSIARTHTDEQL